MIHRGRSGFGFSISGECPVTVCRVDEGSLASLGGLRVDDVLVAVDGQSVTSAASETVAALVRYSRSFVPRTHAYILPVALSHRGYGAIALHDWCVLP